jgi:drug/metabolite transporter (DMT)-like permease
MTRRGQGLVGALAGVCLLGTSSVLIKAVRLPGPVLALHRLWVGAVLVGAVLLLVRRPITVRQLRLSLAGGAALAFTTALAFTAFKHTTVANVTVITALQPIMVFALAGRAFGERVRPLDVALVLLAVVGVGVVVAGSTGFEGASLRGDLLALASLFTWTWYFVASKRARGELDALQYQTALTAVAATMMLPIALLSGAPVMEVGAWDAAGVVAVAAVASSGLLVLNWAHRYTTLSQTSTLTVAIPVVASLEAAVFLAEPLLPVQILGMAVAVGSLAVVLPRLATEASTATASPE